MEHGFRVKPGMTTSYLYSHSGKPEGLIRNPVVLMKFHKRENPAVTDPCDHVTDICANLAH